MREKLKRILRIFLHIFVFAVLTILTQIGGIVYLLHFLPYRFISRKISKPVWSRLAKTGTFLLFYSAATFLFVPLLAGLGGRVPMPLTENRFVQPHNVLTCFLNRHYVKRELRDVTFAVAEQLQKQHPGTVISYLDANFPFIDGFPLLPHLSHNDGRKLDLSFYYTNPGGEAIHEAPSFTGYGICEEPLPGEHDQPALCALQDHSQYSLLKKLTPQGSKNSFIFDANRTRQLAEGFAAQPAIGKLFIEPHLKTRLQLGSTKFRYHGCRAVRHDDHLHVQLKNER